MSIFLKLLLIQFIIVSVTDYSGFPDDAIKPLLNKLFGIGNPSKIFTCSYCQTFWCSLLYMICTGAFSLPMVAFALLLSALTPVTLDIIWFVRDFLQAIVSWLRYITGLK